MPEEQLPYRIRQDFLSPSEMTFFRLVADAMHDRFYVCAKVSLQELFSVTRPNENVHYFNKIYRKTIDFLLISHTNMKPVLGVKLFHLAKSHHRPRDEFLDQVFAAANLPLVYVPLQEKYEVAEIAGLFKDAMRRARDHQHGQEQDFSPICPNCEITMVLRFYTDGPKKGQQYYGCLNFPDCKAVVAMPAGQAKG